MRLKSKLADARSGIRSLGRIFGLPAKLLAGVFDLDTQTPATSMPLSIARMPNGTSPPGASANLPRLTLRGCCISCLSAALFAVAIAVYFRSFQWLYTSLTHPRRMTTTYVCQLGLLADVESRDVRWQNLDTSHDFDQYSSICLLLFPNSQSRASPIAATSSRRLLASWCRSFLFGY